MNRRNFFSLFGLAALTAIVRPKPKAQSILDFPPLDLGQLKPLSPEEKLQEGMLNGYYADAVRLPASHSHSINDPGHSHSLGYNGSGFGQPVKANPNWIPCDGQWVYIDRAGIHYVDGKPKPMHYIHYDVV
jgi:hypothetical protein